MPSAAARKPCSDADRAPIASPSATDRQGVCVLLVTPGVSGVTTSCAWLDPAWLQGGSAVRSASGRDEMPAPSSRRHRSRGVHRQRRRQCDPTRTRGRGARHDTGRDDLRPAQWREAPRRGEGDDGLIAIVVGRQELSFVSMERLLTVESGPSRLENGSARPLRWRRAGRARARRSPSSALLMLR